MPRRVLTINSGSSSLKYSVYEVDPEERVIVSGNLEGAELQNRESAIGKLLEDLRGRGALGGVGGLGYRIVHGGMHHSEPERLTPALLDELKTLAPLAPDHLPDQIAAIEALSRLAPELEPVACFDTAFHRTMPRIAQLYGLTRELGGSGRDPVWFPWPFLRLSGAGITGSECPAGTRDPRALGKWRQRRGRP